MSEETTSPCPICLDEYTEDHPKTTLECNHTFHSDCIINWFRTPSNQGTCPLCRGVPITGTSRMSLEQRYSNLRRRARAKKAPVDLKRRVEKVKKIEREIKENKITKKEFFKREDVQEILKTANKLRQQIYRDRRRLRRAKVNVAIFQAPGYDPPGFIQEAMSDTNRRLRRRYYYDYVYY